MSGQLKSKPADAPTTVELESLFQRQMTSWALVRDNYAALSQVLLRNAGPWQVQFNPARARSAKARVDVKSIGERPCFLCRDNRPAGQMLLPWRGYEILVNPYPIFDRHYTVALNEHEPQSIKGRVQDMADLAANLDGHVVFYNGPHCGASAPDHLHLQIARWPEAYRLLTYDCPDRLVEQFDSVADAECMLTDSDDVNMLAISHEGAVSLFVVPRRAHRPGDYDTTLISPGAVDVAGRFITVRRDVFDTLTESDIDRIFREVCKPIS